MQYILDSVVSQLLLDPNRRFIYVEMAFFARWWLEQSDHVKSQVKMLVDEGPINFELLIILQQPVAQLFAISLRLQ